ncbi:MAG: DUF2309 family protein, partial [Ferruginibacter sp.]|nr:DUF2309 family protein [Chitinophagaceae bacterium]
MNDKHFDEKHVVHELKHYLPSQQALKDFIHHNSLHAFQHMKFYDALFKAATIFGFQVSLQLPEFRQLYKNGRIREDILDKVIEDKKGKAFVEEWKHILVVKEHQTITLPRIGQLRRNWNEKYAINLDNEVHPLLFRILCSFLDQGIAIDHFPVSGKSFLESIKDIEQNSFASFFKTKRVRQLFLSGDYSITSLMNTIVGKEEYYEQYLFDQQFAHHGWSGFISAVEDNPQTLLDTRKISLNELIAFELLLELDVLNYNLGNDWQPMATQVTDPPLQLFEDIEKTEFAEVIELWQDAFEWSYYDSVLAGIQFSHLNDEPENGREMKTSRKEATRPGLEINSGKAPSFQAIFCIDERECSIRRHTEATDKNCETFGAP